MTEPTPLLRERLNALIAFYEDIRPETIEQLAQLYTADARFADPFNQVQGLEGIQRIFSHMFQQVSQPRFKVDTTLLEGDQAVLIWRFMFRSGQRDITVHGSSHLSFDATGLVSQHQDYWDAAGELYAKFPVIGALMRWLARRLSASTGH